MSLGTRSFPYPVLAGFNDDYLESEFLGKLELEIENVNDASKITLQFQLELSSEFLTRKIESGAATYVLDIFSKQTLFRQTFPVANSGSLTFENGELFGSVEVTPYILSQETDARFSPTGVHAEYRDSLFTIGVGDVLAIGATTLFEVAPDTSSMPELMTVELAPDLSPSAYEIDLQGSSILIRVGVDVMAYWEMASGDGQMKPNLFQSIYKDCIFFALQEIAYGGGQEDAMWAKALESRAREKGHLLSPALGAPELNAIALDLVSPQGLKKLLKNAGN